MDGVGVLKIAAKNIQISQSQDRQDLNVPPGEYIALCVSDHGAGMPPEILEKALEPFFTTKEVGAGTGLGLSMVYGFTEQSNGALTLESQEGRGTTVTMYLPSEKKSGVKLGARTEHPSRQILNFRTILLVEDQPDLRAVNERVLRKLGHRVLIAEDGKSALDIVRKSPQIDAAFIDVILPGNMNGIELAQELRAEVPNMPVLFTSGYASKDILAKLESIPHDGLFRKPIKIKEVAQRLSEVFGKDTPADAKLSGS